MLNKITQELVLDLFIFKNGSLYWKRRRGSSGAGKEAGYLQNNGYKSVMINGRNYLQHRIVWLYHYGKLPKMLDHINHDRTDNRLENLRPVKSTANAKNLSKRTSNKSGHTGVYWDKTNKKWKAQIGVEGRVVSLGRYIELEDAVKARLKALSDYRFHPNHGVLV